VERVSWLVADGARPSGTLAHLAQLAAARRSTLTGVVALHTRGVPDVPERVQTIRFFAAAWPSFGTAIWISMRPPSTSPSISPIWPGAKARIERATTQAQRYWSRLYGDDDLLLSMPGMGPVTASVIRGFLAEGSAFASAKAAASYVGLNPSTWSSGTVSQPSRAITKEGPAVLWLAFFQAGTLPAGKTITSLLCLPTTPVRVERRAVSDPSPLADS
jgi:hypothetical protein